MPMSCWCTIQRLLLKALLSEVTCPNYWPWPGHSDTKQDQTGIHLPVAVVWPVLTTSGADHIS